MTLSVVVDFPSTSLQDIPSGLRNLADAIERGDYDDCHNLTWVIDKGDGKVAVGLLGVTAEPGAVAYYLHGCAMKKLLEPAA